jgi:hypothetical protein
MADERRAPGRMPGFLDRSVSRRHLMKGLVGLMAAGAVAPLAAACAPQQAPAAPPAPAGPGAKSRPR